MTLSEMAAFVCDKVRQTDATAIAQCKAFLRRRYEMIWQDELWRDSVWQYQFTFTPDDPNTSLAVPESWGGIYMFPNIVDRVLSVRRAEGEIANVAAEMLFRFDPDQWPETGKPERFVTLPPCVTILPAEYAYHDLSMASSGPDAGITYSVVYLDQDNNRHTVSQTLATQDIASDVAVVEKATKLATQFSATLTVNNNNIDVVECAAEATSFPLRVPIQLIPRPTEETDFRALVKKKPLPFSEDGAEPELRGVDNCLMAFAHADMLQRSRQYGKSQAVVAEATALLGQLKRVAVVQENTRQQIVPVVGEVSGSVDEWSGKSFW